MPLSPPPRRALPAAACWGSQALSNLLGGYLALVVWRLPIGLAWRASYAGLAALIILLRCAGWLIVLRRECGDSSAKAKAQ